MNGIQFFHQSDWYQAINEIQSGGGREEEKGTTEKERKSKKSFQNSKNAEVLNIASRPRAGQEWEC